MRYSGMILNDITAAPGLCVSFFTQGCPHHCKGCHNPETWRYDGGNEFTDDVMYELIEGLTAQGIVRNLCIMGGEPLCPENVDLVDMIIQKAKEKSPQSRIYVWTGYVYEELAASEDPVLRRILAAADTLIDGPYIEERRDVTLLMRGSSNHRIIDLT